MEPTLAPVAVERTMTTRAAASVLPDSFSSTNFFDFRSYLILLHVRTSFTTLAGIYIYILYIIFYSSVEHKF